MAAHLILLNTACFQHLVKMDKVRILPSTWGRGGILRYYCMFYDFFFCRDRYNKDLKLGRLQIFSY